ncbi:HAD family phosphatase [Sphingobacteriaceae bacterium WQ 2009]|uniref:HAD family phosphatase n=1 Tax=Rhinopithecimicrobium faecis TaxID=2820698 RepID=A0A8T4HBF6_9SPHI|nr:HAD family phosphatase [Sphingobacteriaceae bacterium WQ 2009]
MKQYAVLFDMDGVICHTNPYHVKAFEAFFKNHHISYAEKDFDQHIHGKHNSYIMSHFFQRPIVREELETLEFEKEALFRQIYKDQVESLPNFLPFLADLKAHGFKTAVATSAPYANLALILSQLHIAPQMESILASEDVKLHKPHPEVYLKSAENIGVPATQCLVFEDSFSGVTAGLNAGMRVVGVLTTHRKKDLPGCVAYINDFSEITAEKVIQLLKEEDFDSDF